MAGGVGRRAGAAVLVGAVLAGGPAEPAAAAPPPIRLTDANAVPECVTPERLMAFLKQRNPKLDKRFADIAAWYKYHGETWRVRWDYAFFQMAIETNFLTYRQGNGKWGDVNPNQHNFAGIGTTGGGVPGDKFPDVGTGVLAQIQHLVAYSGERVTEPVASRTRLRQDDIIEISRKLKRPVLFSDLARRWAVDHNYGRSIEWIASKFRATYCQGERQEVAAAPKLRIPESLPWAVAAAASGVPAPKAAKKAVKAGALADVPIRADHTRRNSPPRHGLGHAPHGRGEGLEPAPDLIRGVGGTTTTVGSPPLPNPPPQGGREPPVAAAPPAVSERCEVMVASYGGETTLLIRSAEPAAVRYTALTVQDGFEDSMAASYIRAYAPGGEQVGAFATKDAALAKARELCPGA